MKKRRAKLISLALVISMTVSGGVPAISAMASETGNDFTAQSEEALAQSEEGTAPYAEGDVQEEAFHGLAAEYYTTRGSGRNVVFDTKKSDSIDYHIQYADMDGKLKEQTGRDNSAGVRWSGRIKVPETGNYTFYGYADNGLRLWVNGEQLIDYWDGGSWDVLQTSKQVYLEAGKYYTFQADYFEYEGGSHVTLSWSNDQGITERSAIPQSAFYLPDNYEGLYVSEIDTADANLTEGEKFDGHITVEGTGFTDQTVFEIVKASGAAMSDPAAVEVLSVSETKAALNISSLQAGTYKIKAVNGSANVVSKSMVVVQPASLEGQTRTERPRADWERKDFVNLNGWWDFSFDPTEEGLSNGWYKADAKLQQMINVPFCWESSLSGVEDTNYLGQAWYQKKVTVDKDWDGRKLFLKFGAVDWKCKLWVNGQEVGEHVGGYNAFEFDVTEYLKAGEENTITLWVEDKGSYGDDSYPALIGKQGRNAPCGYIHTSGIWQTVGLEARSATYLDNAKATTDVDKSTVTYTMDVTSDVAQEVTVEYDFESKVYDIEKDEDIPTGSTIKGSWTISVEAGKNTVDLETITVENPKLWNYDDPNLYYGTLTVKDSEGAVLDTVETYFGMRKVEQKYFDESLGVKYIYINNKPVYMSGLLDQGFWEDGIYTAPSEEALKYDILQMKETGFNMIRKHLKVEDPLQYYWCDKLGMMVWQDMPHATAMVPDKTGDATPGRQYYEECLEAMMNMNYNHPSIVAVMLFNETWGLQNAYFNGKRDVVAADGRSTKDWVEELFYRAKALNSNLLVEDMSACNGDHVQPTELNTYHMYPDNYQSTVNTVERWVNSAFVGSTDNFKFNEIQDGDPLLNSEYGGVGAGSGDFDVSYCFKYMTDIQRRYEKQSGFVYTEPFDVEYERNGFMTYDRKMKVFGYDEVAYGGDMTAKDLIQEIYVGLVDQPIRTVTPGQKMKTKAMAIGWTEDLPEKAVLKWRFDGTDIYGNSISTEKAGEKILNLSPYRKSTTTISYTAPEQACVGTLTIWLEDENGNKLAKNFTNVIVKDETAENKAYTQKNTDGSVVMKAKVSGDRMNSTDKTGAQSYSYTLPEDFSLESLKGMRVLAEASSYKTQIGDDKFLSSFSSQWGQTAEGRERPSDLTVSVNGVELDTVYLPDNPRDIRGTLTLDKPYNGNTSAGDFGYLLNLNVTEEKLQAIKDTLGDGRELTVTYEVKEDAENQNGFRIYTAEYGRYAVNPTLILNPSDQTVNAVTGQAQTIDADGDNYSVEAKLEKKESYVVRNDNQGGYRVEISEDGSEVAVINAKTGEVLANSEIKDTAAAHEVKTTLFDEQIRVYVDNDPEAVINVYDRSGFTGDVTVNEGAENVVVAPESYEAVKTSVNTELPEVDFTDDFSVSDLSDRYQRMGNNLRAEVQNETLKLSAGGGDKLILKDMQIADGIYEADITIDSLGATNGNVGLTFRSTNYQIGADGLDGYYAGFGNGFVQLGRMNNNWTELKMVEDDNLKTGTTHRLRVAVFGSRIQVYVDNEKTPHIDIIDTTYTEGGAAIRGFNCSSTIDNIRIASTLNYTSDFSHGVGEWDANGAWKNEDGVYRVSGKNVSAFVDGTEQKNVAVSADLIAEDNDALPALMLRASETAEGLDGYRAVLNVKESKIQLVKSVKGVDTVLAEREWDLAAGVSYRLSAEANGGSLKVYLNGSDKALFAVEDISFEKGMAGLYSGQGISAFDNVSINADFVNGEVLAPANTAGLDAVIALAEKLDKDQYTEKSYARVAEALAAAKEVSRYDQKQIDQAAENLQTAMELLIPNGSGVDLEELQEAVKKAELAQKKAEEAKKQAEAARDEAAQRAEEAEAAKQAAEMAKQAAEQLANASAEQKAAAEKAAKEAEEKAAEAQRQAQAAAKAVEAAEAARDTAEEAAVKALNEVKAVRAELQAAKEELEKLKGETQKAKEEAEKARQEAAEAAKKAQETAEALRKELEKQQQISKDTVRKGQVFDDGKLKYKVTSVENKTVSVIGSVNEKETSVVIKSSVKLSGISCKITAVAKNAFRNNRNLKKAVIGKNVKTIGSKAFYKNSKLKDVTVKTSKLKSVGKDAFKGIDKNAYINVPNKKAAKYRKLFKNAGQSQTVKIK